MVDYDNLSVKELKALLHERSINTNSASLFPVPCSMRQILFFDGWHRATGRGLGGRLLHRSVQSCADLPIP
jgi:hypothetical protein